MRGIKRNRSFPSKSLTYQFGTKSLHLHFTSLWILHISIIKFNKSLQRKDSGAMSVDACIPHLHQRVTLKYEIRSATSFLNEANRCPGPLSGEAALLYQLQDTEFCSVLLTDDTEEFPTDGKLGIHDSHVARSCLLFPLGEVKVCVRGGWWGGERKGTKETMSSPAPDNHPTALLPNTKSPAPFLAPQLLLLSPSELQLAG